MKRKCSSQKFIIEIYVFLFFTLKNSFSYRERVLLSSRICIPIKKFPIERRQLFVRDSFDYFEFLQKKKKEPVSVTTLVISKMIDLAPKPSNSKKIDLPHGKKVFRTSQGRPTRRHAQEFHPRFSNIGHIV